MESNLIKDKQRLTVTWILYSLILIYLRENLFDWEMLNGLSLNIQTQFDISNLKKNSAYEYIEYIGFRFKITYRF